MKSGALSNAVQKKSFPLNKRAIILCWMMARSESWLSVTSSAGVGSYKYSYYQRKRANPCQKNAVVWTNAIRIGARRQHHQ
jgi:hypothetical protein